MTNDFVNDSLILAIELQSAMRFLDIKLDEPMFVFTAEQVIRYHNDVYNVARKDCKWCAKLDEDKNDGWYDGWFCPTCGYVRGMHREKK